jgi:hypothetical protein
MICDDPDEADILPIRELTKHLRNNLNLHILSFKSREQRTANAKQAIEIVETPKFQFNQQHHELDVFGNNKHGQL